MLLLIDLIILLNFSLNWSPSLSENYFFMKFLYFVKILFVSSDLRYQFLAVFMALQQPSPQSSSYFPCHQPLSARTSDCH